MPGIYLHVPFCRQKCPYCDFYSVPSSEERMESYTQKLLSLIRTCPFPRSLGDSVYFGGGTPSVLGASRLISLLQAVQERWSLSSETEITLEANPACISFEDLSALRRAGFNRLSLGVQSVNPSSLSLLGRIHSATEAIETVKNAKRAGFLNLSVDLMLATPGQTKEDISSFISSFAALEVPHISGYLLKIEENTAFARQNVQDLCPDEEVSRELYLWTVEQMEKAGYQQYEISNFSLPGYESRHNLTYWNDEEYLGLGPAAHSFLEGRRFFFPRDLTAFLHSDDPWRLCQIEGPGGDFGEYVMLRLRLREGLTLQECCKRFPLAGEQNFTKLIQRAKQLPSSLLMVLPDRIALLPEGFVVSNAVITFLLSALDE